MTHSKPSVDGVLLVDKEPGMTSHDVVGLARKRLGIKKIGHCGTLDPMATGLLILVVGRATKIQDLLMSEDKQYEGTITLGTATDTQDKEGKVIATHHVAPFTEERIRVPFEKMMGDFYQMPPMVSAIKKDGVPLYKLARQGKSVEREPRLVHVYSYQILHLALPEIGFRVLCSKGFYVRTYADDVGRELGCGAHLSALRRTRSGNFDLRPSITVSALRQMSPLEIGSRLISLPEVSRLRGA